MNTPEERIEFLKTCELTLSTAVDKDGKIIHSGYIMPLCMATDEEMKVWKERINNLK